MAAGFSNGTICIWFEDSTMPDVIFNPESISMMNQAIRFVAWNEVDPYTALISANAAGNICVWDVAKSLCVNSFGSQHADTDITALAISDNGELMASGDSKAVINLWMFFLDPRVHQWPDPIMSIRHNKTYMGTAKIEQL